MDRPGSPFPVGYANITAEQRIALYRMLKVVADDPFMAEEHVLTFAANTLCRLYEAPFQQRRDHASHQALVLAVQIVLGQAFRDKLTLSQISERVHYSPYALCRVFKQQTGLTLHTYLTRIRLFHALEYLVEFPQVAIADIAGSLGFYSHSQFTTSFSREFGISPARFRKNAARQQVRELSKILQVGNLPSR